MALIFAFLIFVASMTFCLVTKISILIAMSVGWITFTVAGHYNGFLYKELNKMAINGIKESFIVLEIMFLIGLITAVWRSAGTITFFVYYGISIITPTLFIITSFLLCCLLSYILGTSFGVAGTLGVIIMVLARSGNVNEAVIAGAVISGVYFGDRASPVSSSAILVANITKTNIYDNVKMMFRTSWIPMIIMITIYTLLSILNPLESINNTVVKALQSDFNISIWVVIPALFMFILPLLKVDIVWVFITSIISGFFITIFVQNMSIMDTIICCITGYEASSIELSRILNGGGIISMLTVCGVVMISSAYSGIFKGTDMLSSLQDKISKISNKIGRFETMLVASTLVTCVFCNQTIASMMSRDLMVKTYEEKKASNTELAMDIENSSIVICGLIPWAISCSVPLSMLGVGYSALPYAFLLYGIPLGYIFTKKFVFK